MIQRYTRSSQWEIRETGPHIVLERAGRGRVLIDELTRRLLESIDHHTEEEIAEKSALDRPLLAVFLLAMVRLGALEAEPPAEAPDRAGAEAAPLSRTPLVSILVVNYNGEEHLPELLDSLERQSYPDREVVVVDNDSRDGSRPLLRSRAAGVRLVEMKRNAGFAAAVNAGLARARGEFVLLLNNDTVLDRNALLELVRAAGQYERWSAIAPKILYHDNPCFINSIGNAVRDHDWGADNFFGFLDLNQFDGVKNSPSACFAAALLNRGTVARIGGLDEFYRFYYEDMDWCYRAQFRGFPVHAAPAAVVYHKGGASMGRRAEGFKLRFVVGNRLYFACKNLERTTLKRALGNYLREDAAALRHLLRRGNFALSAAYLRGYLRFLGALPALLRRRKRELAARAGVSDEGLLLTGRRPGWGLLHDGLPVLTLDTLRSCYREEEPRPPGGGAEPPGRGRGPSAGGPAPEPAIRVSNLTKKFGRITALDGVDLCVPRGSIVGLLGPNGAGKTTLIRVLVGAVRAAGGSVEVLGRPMPAGARAVRSRAGYMPQTPTLYGDLTVRDNVAFFGSAHLRKNLSARVSEVLAFVGLAGQADRKVDTLSGGWKQRCSLACAMVHEPELLLLDEPTSGVDPILKEAFWKGFRELADRGTTILISTHHGSESLACDRICVLREGRLVAQDTPAGFMARGGATVELNIGGEWRRHRLEENAETGLPRLLAGYGLAENVGAVRVVPDSFDEVILRLLRSRNGQEDA